jgi:hypothetical protein
MKQGFLNIGKLFYKKEKKQAYKSIKKLPISVWWDITENGNFNGLVIDGKYSEIELYNIYLDLLQEYYDHFGTSETHEAFINAKMNYALKLAKWISTQNGTDKMFLEMSLIDFREATPIKDQNESKQSLSQAIAIIEENFFQVDEDKLSVYKFYSYQKRIADKFEAQKQLIKR